LLLLAWACLPFSGEQGARGWLLVALCLDGLDVLGTLHVLMLMHLTILKLPVKGSLCRNQPQIN